MDLRTRTKQLGANEKARRKMRDVKFFVYHEKSDLSEKSMRTGARKLLRTGLVPARAWRGQAVGIAPTERLELRRQMAAAGKEESVSLSLFM